MRDAGERAAGLTRQLLAFSRKQVLQPRVIDLNERLRGAERLLRRLIGEDVELVVEPDPAPALVRIDPGQAEQVVMNLCVNARDAMPRGGTLTIRTAHVEWAGPDGLPVRGVRLTVADTGHGMDAATQARIFDPFFTTKGVGKGTVGLSTVYGIVKQSGGSVAVAPEPGRGTTFTIDLPAAEASPAPAKSRPLVRAAAPGTGTVLVVEDEDGVRSLVRPALAGHGYAVLEAADGEAAVRVAEGHRGPIHLLMTDVVMPRLGGPEVAERLTRARPGLRVLYTSGYPDDAVVRYGVSEAEVAFLQKPFTPAALLQKVRGVLEQA